MSLTTGASVSDVPLMLLALPLICWAFSRMRLPVASMLLAAVRMSSA